LRRKLRRFAIRFPPEAFGQKTHRRKVRAWAGSAAKRARHEECHPGAGGGAGKSPAETTLSGNRSMRYLALACDYDGTLAHDGRVSEATLSALERLRASGRKLILVTGRELDDLRSVFSAIHLFDRVVAENGAVLYRPGSRDEKILGVKPPEAFVQRLARRGVQPLSVGRVIVATRHPHETVVLETIQELGLELQVIFNKGAVMVLPAGTNKATGLAAALQELELSAHNVVGVGDAENDHAFLASCECAVAVANAIPMLKERADLVTRGDHGAGVIELVDRLLGDDLSAVEGRLERHELKSAIERRYTLPASSPRHRDDGRSCGAE
jgi:HAD superfamily hydrolase (TIGR01484 family)